MVTPRSRSGDFDHRSAKLPFSGKNIGSASGGGAGRIRKNIARFHVETQTIGGIGFPGQTVSGRDLAPRHITQMKTFPAGNKDLIIQTDRLTVLHPFGAPDTPEGRTGLEIPLGKSEIPVLQQILCRSCRQIQGPEGMDLMVRPRMRERTPHGKIPCPRLHGSQFPAPSEIGRKGFGFLRSDLLFGDHKSGCPFSGFTLHFDLNGTVPFGIAYPHSFGGKSIFRIVQGSIHIHNEVIIFFP